MKAVQIEAFGGAEVLKLAEVAEPVPNQGEVKVKLYAAGVNPNDVYTISGKYAYLVPDLPYTPGFDGAGIVEETGADVSELQAGDRVFVRGFTADRLTGTYAEKVVCSATEVHPLPANVTFNEGAGIGIPTFAAYRALFQKAEIRAGEIVLIHGASGAVGNAAIQMAKAIGAFVIGTSSTASGRERILSLGADYALDHISVDNQSELLAITNQNGPDVIIEMLANANLETDTKVIAKAGRIVIIGSRGTIEITPRNLMTSEAYVTGISIADPSAAEVHEILAGVEAFLKTGALKIQIGRVYPLKDAREALGDLLGKAGDGKTVLMIAAEKP